MRKKTPERVQIAVIGGSGLYAIPGVEDVQELRVPTPFGVPSDKISVGRLSGVRCAFLPRHGRGHRLLPSEVPSRANLYALKSLGVERVIGVGAVGSLKEELAPRHFVVPDQVVDRTWGRPVTFFGEGIVAHTALDHPFCEDLRRELVRAGHDVGAAVHSEGTYVCIQGPHFSTKAESRMHRDLGFSVVGMTLAPEFKLAREAELCYATVSLVTDYDVWKEGEEVSVDKVAAVMHDNVDRVNRLLSLLLPRLAADRTCRCGQALQGAVFTDPRAMNPVTRRKLNLVLGPRVLPKKERAC
ncbi:MAG: S-methyl-5'-thioadenosine phosphorylase [Elusimicrobia bacterium]|nr:S-methyl-5'-thioadenosine phosphorylase [Elusimicrobiota bacterium]MBP9699265.1 S-methyl-5'-thioadenosine phosphorylase [Elusimicrobiota bacterium]